LLTGDDLTIQLFIGASAVATLGVAVTQAGWTHKWFVGSLFVIAAALALLAVFWKPIRDAHPEIGPVASEVAGSSISWFTLLLVGFGIVFFLDLLARTGWLQTAQSKRGGGGDKSEPSKDRIFVSVTPEYLMGFYEGRTAIQGDQLAQNYIGKWLKVSGQVGGANATWSTILVSLKLTEYKTIQLLFDEEWEERISLLISDQKITAIGEIASAGNYNIMLKHCELVET
jgi:hypothetical protein